MNPLNNEQRCTLAQKGDLNVRNLLLENNLNFIREIVNELYRGMNLSESDLGIEKEDLKQEDYIGLLDAIPHLSHGKGIKFLTYTALSIQNAMTDLIRKALAQYEHRMTDTKDGFAYQKFIWMKSFLARSECCGLKLLLIQLSNRRSKSI